MITVGQSRTVVDDEAQLEAGNHRRDLPELFVVPDVPGRFRRCG